MKVSIIALAIVWSTIITIFLLVFLVFAPIGEACTDKYTPNSNHKSTYTVKKGDTLANIAQECLGDYRKWRSLVEINKLNILPNNVVIIYPGQTIKLKEVTKVDVKHYRETTKAFIEDWVLRVKRLHKAPDSLYPESYLPGREVTHQLVYKDIQKYKNRILFLRKCAARLYVKEIYQRALMMGRGDCPFLKGELWQKERQAALLLIAIGWQESTYRYVYGQHGEVGWFQVKPLTAYDITKEMWKGIDKKVALKLIERKLMDDPNFVMGVVGQLLKEHPTFTDALAKGYNKGKLKYHYAHLVLLKYYKLHQRIGG